MPEAWSNPPPSTRNKISLSGLAGEDENRKRFDGSAGPAHQE